MAIQADRYRAIFSFPAFNAVQSECFDLIYSHSNVVISAPTGAGKTVLMELAILRLLGRPRGDQSKVVYVAPTKALCSERVRDWQHKFSSLGLTCQELTGDTDLRQTTEIQRCNILVTTPEKWDTTTRRWHDLRHFMNMLRLVLLDEVHMLKEESRGATLEVIVSRMKTIHHELGANALRIVAISATVPNIADVAEWLCNARGEPAALQVFGEAYRPVKLVKEVLGYHVSGGNSFVFERSLDSKLMDVICRYSSGKPVLVFCSTRKSAMEAAEHLAAQFKATPSTQNPFDRLAEVLAQRVGFHHGGLAFDDRQKVESLFIGGAISVICTTSTLAVGVNLPARLVIVKGTMQYVNGRFSEYTKMDIEQMIGRAGRPQFDDSGVAVIMTSIDCRQRLMDIVSGQETIESSLHENLIEHLNAEVVLGSIRNPQQALEWLKSTFLHVRIQKNPSHYRLKDCAADTGRLSAENRLEGLLHREQMCSEPVMLMACRQRTDFAKAMAKYYCKFETVLSFVHIERAASLERILEVLSQAKEFSTIRFHSDKAHLNVLNKHPDIRFRIQGRIATPDQKQKSMHAMGGETATILQNASRVARCMCDVLIARRDHTALKNAIVLSQSIQARTWDSSRLQLKQLDGLGPQLSRNLAHGGITTFAQLLDAGPRRIEMLAGRNPPFGNKVQSIALWRDAEPFMQ
ncbi:P-loop containing nucleoside triphosphate hydrolase protein [Entophlyctis helioformis]|nr:P-loop containing nucleoside triphosphate hydrolase protein [Entophlyctis helioformis]